HVARVEVEIVLPVDVREAGTGSSVDVDGHVVVRGHPRHRRGVRHVVAGAFQERERPRMRTMEPVELRSVEGPDPVSVEVAQGRHAASVPATARIPRVRGLIYGSAMTSPAASSAWDRP